MDGRLALGIRRDGSNRRGARLLGRFVVTGILMGACGGDDAPPPTSNCTRICATAAPCARTGVAGADGAHESAVLSLRSQLHRMERWDAVTGEVFTDTDEVISGPAGSSPIGGRACRPIQRLPAQFSENELRLATAVPMNLRISASGRSFIEWSWDAVEAAHGYTVQFSDDEVFTDTDEVISRTGGQLSYRREGLPLNTSGYLRVQSFVRVGDSEVTSQWSEYVEGMAIPPPAVPMNLRISASGRSFIEWSWDAVEAAHGYTVQFSDDEVFTDTDEVISRTGGQLSYRREGLPPNTSAYLRVQSVVRAGEVAVTSDWSGHVTGVAAPPLPGLLVTPEELLLSEGETATLRIRLAASPTSPVTVAISAQVHAYVFHEHFGKEPPLSVVRGSRLTFDEATWNAEQEVTIVAGEDFDTSDEEVSIYVDTTSDDPNYEMLARHVIPAAVSDNDPHRLNILREGSFWYNPPEGITWYYAVSLSGRPKAVVRLEITSSDPGAVVVTEGSALSFTPEDFHVPQPFHLRSVEGRAFDQAVIRLAATGGGYDGLNDRFWITAVPAEVAELEVLSVDHLSLTEGETATFTVRPALAPDPETEIAITSFYPDRLSIVGGEMWYQGSSRFDGRRPIHSKSLSFTVDDWETAQDVEIEAHHDDDSDDQQLVLFFRTSGVLGPNHTTWLRPGGGARGMLITIYDDDHPER